jgi:pimeloyl-ACP methyl ester carboxylesterase
MQNAGHVANGWRPDTYHALTDTTSYHVITIDYRGFGLSTGTPSEPGLILDGVALVDWVINVAGVPPERIVLFGQSLGTAVVSGVAEVCAADGLEFAGIVLVACFSNLPAMLTGYRISGYVPVFGPFQWIPFTSRWLQKFVYEKWRSDERLPRVVELAKSRLRLTLVHAKDDMDIPCLESDKLFRATAMATLPGVPNGVDFESMKEDRTTKRGEDGFVTTWTAEPDIVIRHEQFPHGGEQDIWSMTMYGLVLSNMFYRPQLYHDICSNFARSHEVL